jgi:heat shock protein HslJ
LRLCAIFSLAKRELGGWNIITNIAVLKNIIFLRNLKKKIMSRKLFYAITLVVASCVCACGVQQKQTNQFTSEKSTFDDATNITNKHWKLVELNGNPVNFPEASTAVFILLNSDGRVSGNLGCNSFTGSFTLQEGNRIAFSQLVNTQKMCLDMSIENEMIRVLQSADNYNLNEKQLVLNRARMAPLARFEIAHTN